MKPIPIAPRTGTRTTDTHETEGERAEVPRGHFDGRTEYDLFGEPKQGTEDINPKTSTPDAPCRRQEPPERTPKAPEPLENAASTSRRPTNAVSNAATPPAIPLRLSPRHLAQLRALHPEDLLDEAALDLFLGALEGETGALRVGGHYERFEAQIRELRRDLSISVQVLLVTIGRQTPQDARLWAEKNIG